MNCLNCDGKDTIVYANLMRYEHVYKINKDNTIAKTYTKTPVSDSQLDYCYCTKCLKVFNTDFDSQGRLSITDIDSED